MKKKRPVGPAMYYYIDIISKDKFLNNLLFQLTMLFTTSMISHTSMNVDYALQVQILCIHKTENITEISKRLMNGNAVADYTTEPSNKKKSKTCASQDQSEERDKPIVFVNYATFSNSKENIATPSKQSLARFTADRRVKEPTLFFFFCYR
jgi:ketol-acid reductoisomerase